LRLRRKFRAQKRQVEGITVQADDTLDKHLFRRMGRLQRVQRFVITWTALLLFIGFGAIWQVKGLDKFYLELAPVGGGIYREGLIGSFTTANPLFATSSADVAVSKLVFSGLFKIAPSGELEPDLALSYSVDSDNQVYTVTLRENVSWHDGEKFDADDVAFTYNRIKNPELKSPLFSGWSSVDVKAIDDRTVSFTLPNTLSSFQYSLINGIVPEHILSKVSASDARSDEFNTVSPVGTGPFRYVSVELLGDNIDDRREKVTLERNEFYYGRRPNINGVTIRTYRDEEKMLQAFNEKEIASMVGLQTVSDSILDDDIINTFSTPITSQVMLFLNNSNPILSDQKVRQALTHGTDTNAVRQAISYPLIASDAPFLKSHFSYNADKTQLGYDFAQAEKLLDEAGWLRGEDGVRRKDDQVLGFRLLSQSLTEYATVVRVLQEQWAKLGVNLDAILQPEEDIQTGAIIRHDYDILLYGISLGPDPDVFPYWHSSQADKRLRSRLNLSEYSNKVVDSALEAGRTRLDKELRTLKYQPFLDAWRIDAPAIALYQPRFLFVVRGTLENYKSGEFNGPSDRFYSVSDWLIRREQVIKD
jgi:peptide/nickel transport system substrate-binding protein